MRSLTIQPHPSPHLAIHAFNFHPLFGWCFSCGKYSQLCVCIKKCHMLVKIINLQNSDYRRPRSAQKQPYSLFSHIHVHPKCRPCFGIQGMILYVFFKYLKSAFYQPPPPLSPCIYDKCPFFVFFGHPSLRMKQDILTKQY